MAQSQEMPRAPRDIFGQLGQDASFSSPSPCPGPVGRSGLFPSSPAGTHGTEFLEPQKNPVWAAREQSEHTWLRVTGARGSERGFHVSGDAELRKPWPRGPTWPWPHRPELQRGLERWSEEVRNSHLLPPPHHALRTILLGMAGPNAKQGFGNHTSHWLQWKKDVGVRSFESVCLSQGRSRRELETFLPRGTEPPSSP